MIKSIRKITVTTICSLCIYGVISHNAFGAVYTVVNGDSVFKISKAFNTSVSNIVKDNNLKTTAIIPGQKLAVSCKTYIVNKGDTLFLLSKKFGTTVKALKTVNSNIPDMLNIGRVINIPPVAAKVIQPVAVVPTAVTSSVVTTQTASASNTANYSASDVDLLARLITAEAQGESINAKVAVGAVVLNRVKSGTFGSTIKDVIYQIDNGHYQFTPVLNGWINKPADQDSITAAYAALNGNDPTNGALYYFDTSITNKWLLSKPVATQIGNLIFAL